MKVAVTGATGFVGRHVLLELARRDGIEATAISRRLADASVLPAGVKHLQMDLEAPTVDDIECIAGSDVLIHLAWTGLPNYQSLHHFATHLGAQYRFLAQMIEKGLPSLVCAGTCFEYGLQSGQLNESMVTIPQNPYGFAKDALRRQLEFLRAQVPFKLTWARLFYLYGEHQPSTSLYSQVVAAGQAGTRSFKMSGGEQLRDYLPVTEVAATIVALALRGADAGVVNICSGQPRSVRSMVEHWLRTHGWAMELELGHYPYPDYEPLAFWGCRERLDRILKEINGGHIGSST